MKNRKLFIRITAAILAVLLLGSLATAAFADDTTSAADPSAAAEPTAAAEPAAAEATPEPEATAAESTPTPEPTAAVTPTAAPTAAPTTGSGNNARIRAVIGANLTDDQVASMYQIFGVTRGNVPELQVTNADERQYLEGYVDDSVIGTRSVSCVYVELLDDGAGMNISVNNVTWCTSDMYMAALATAGITDAKIIVAAPFEVSGTAALVGIYKAYEDITGQKLSDLAKAVSTQELTVTGELAASIGSMDSTSIVNDLKLMLDETVNMTDDQLKQEIIDIAKQYNVTLTDAQINQLIQLCRSLEGLDDASLLSRVQDIQNTLNKVSQAKTQVTGVIQNVKKVVTSISEFFERIGSIIGLNK